jgi:excisionase family DNA binding protein
MARRPGSVSSEGLRLDCSYYYPSFAGIEVAGLLHFLEHALYLCISCQNRYKNQQTNTKNTNMNWVRVAADTGFEEQFVLIGRASVELGISRDTLRRWERAGRIVAHRLDGRNRYFKLRDLLQLRDTRPLTTRQAANILGVSESTVRRMADRGEIEAFRNESGRRLYKADSVHELRTRPVSRPHAFCAPAQAAVRGRMTADTARGLLAATGMLIILTAAYLSGHPGFMHALLNTKPVSSVLQVVQPLDYR